MIKIITYNLGLLDIFLYDKKIFEFAPNTRERSLLICDTLQKLDSDILCFQEFFHLVDKNKIIDALKHIYPYYATSEITKSKCVKKLSSGLITMSKYEIIRIDHGICKSQTLEENLVAPKGYLVTAIDINNTKVNVINIHTTGGGFSHPESKSVDKIRLSQLQEAINSCKNNSEILLCGDLNCGPKVSESVFLDIAKSLQSLIYVILHGIQKTH